MNFATWIPLFAVGLSVLGVSMWHLLTHRVPYMPKWAWALLVLVTFPIGSIVYIVVVINGVGVQRDDAEGRTVE